MMHGTVATEATIRTGLDFEEFFGEHYGTLAAAMLLMSGDPAEAEDVAQEAMARVFERWSRVRAMDSAAGYLYRTAVNVYRSRLRRLAVRTRHLLAPPERDELAASETRNEVLAMLGELPVAQRQALVLVEWLGLSAQEAGRALGIEAVSVRGRLHRARSTMRERFGGDDA